MCNVPSITNKYAAISDSMLIQRINAGNQQAFEMLIGRYQTALLRLIYRLVRDENVAEDVLQHVWLQLYLSSSRLYTDQPLKSWLFRVARNRCLDELRHKSPVYFSELEVTTSEEELLPSAKLLDPALSPEEIAEQHEMRQRLYQAIRTLPPKLRSVVFLRYAEQLSYAEIGQQLGLPVATAKTYFYRAKRLLRIELEEWVNSTS